MAANVVTCQECKVKLKVPEAVTGKRIRCPRCQELIEIDPQPEVNAGATYLLAGSGAAKEPLPGKGASKARKKGRARPYVIPGQPNIGGMIFSIMTGLLAVACLVGATYEIGSHGLRNARVGRMVLEGIFVLITGVGNFFGWFVFMKARPKLVLDEEFLRFVWAKKVIGKIPYSNIHSLEVDYMESEDGRNRFQVLFITLINSDDPSTFWPEWLRRGGYDPYIPKEFREPLMRIAQHIDDRC